MKSLFLIPSIVGALLSIGCVSRVSPMIEGEQAGSFYLRSIPTGRLYGPFSGEENPPGGTDAQVLLSLCVREPSDEIAEATGRIIWTEDHGRQPILPNELQPIERKLARDISFLNAVFTSDVGDLLFIEDEEITHAWGVLRLDHEEALLVRSIYHSDTQTHVSLKQLQVHRALTGRRMEEFEVDGATVNEMVEELKEQVGDVLGNAGITFSVEGDWSQEQRLRFNLRDLRIIDLLECLREAYGIMFRIDGNVIKLSPNEAIRD